MKLQPQTRLGLTVGLLVLGGLTGIYALLQIPVIAVPVLIAFAMNYVVEPFVVRWESQGRTRLGAIVIIFTLILGVLAIVGFQLPGWLQNQWALAEARGPQLFEDLRANVNQIELTLKESVPFLGDLDLAAIAAKGGSFVRTSILPAIPGAVVNMILGGLLIPILLFFILSDGRKARKALLSGIPNRHFEMALNIFYRMDQQVGAYLRGVMLEAFLVGLTAFLMLVLLGVPGAALIGTVVGVTNLIPYFGPVAGFVTGAMYCAVSGVPMVALTGVLPSVLVAQMTDNFVIGPAVIGKAVDVHALVVILLLLVAGKLFGLIGLVIAVPLFAVIRVVIQETVLAVRAYGRYMVD